MKLNKTERKLAKIRNSDLIIEDHGCLIWAGEFEYDEGGVQGFGGYFADASFIMRLMVSVGATSLKGMNGKSCWVVIEDGMISGIEPLHKKEGKPFYIKDWQKWFKERMPQISIRECLTGEK